MPTHARIDRSAIASDAKWIWSHTTPAQLSNLAGTYRDIQSGDYSSARSRSAAGFRVGMENLAIGLSVVGFTNIVIGPSVRASLIAYPVPAFPQSVQKGIFYGRLLDEYLKGDLEWQDIPFYAAPWVLSAAWGRYMHPRSKSSPAARRGNAVGPGGGTKKKTTTPGAKAPSRSRGRSKLCGAPGKRQFPGKCVRLKGHSGPHFYK